MVRSEERAGTKPSLPVHGKVRCNLHRSIIEGFCKSVKFDKEEESIMVINS